MRSSSLRRAQEQTLPRQLVGVAAKVRAARPERVRSLVVLAASCFLLLVFSVSYAGASTGSRITTSTNWPKYRFSLGNTGYNPNETVLGASNVSDLAHAWSSADGAGTPSIVNGVLYTEWGSTNVSAISASTGAAVWTFSTGSPRSGGNLNSPAFKKGVVYAGLSDGLYALRASTGAIKWAFTRGGQFGSNSAAVANGIVYASGTSGFAALKASSGKLLWSKSWITSSSPAVVNGVVYVGSDDGKVYALNASTGKTLWSFQAGIQAIASSPAVVAGVVYVGGSDYNVYALNASKGQVLWSFATGGGYVSSPAVARGVVYIGQQDVAGPGGFEALDASTGQVIWRIPTGDFPQPSVVANGVVYVCELNSQTVHAYDASTGAELWSPGTYANLSPVVVNGALYVSNQGVMHAFRLP